MVTILTALASLLSRRSRKRRGSTLKSSWRSETFGVKGWKVEGLKSKVFFAKSTK